MPKLVVHGASLKCSMGAAPASLSVASSHKTDAEQKPGATVADHAPMVNIAPFGMCSSPTNPQVAAAKSPQPCVPVTPAQWSPGAPAVTIASLPVLTDDSKCNCQWGGIIEIASPGCGGVQVGT